MTNDGKYVILLVDDDADFRDILKAKLESGGFVIFEAVDGEDGLKKIRSSKPDLVVMDVQMPKMNGVEALSKIKVDPDILGTKVIFVTNYGENDPNDNIDDKFAMEAGALGHIRKTEDLGVIVERIKRELS